VLLLPSLEMVVVVVGGNEHGWMETGYGYGLFMVLSGWNGMRSFGWAWLDCFGEVIRYDMI